MEKPLSQVTELKYHPLVSHNLAILRNKTTDSQAYREASHRLSTMVFLSAAERLETRATQVETPLASTHENTLSENLWLVPILRAGLAMVDTALNLVPEAQVGFVGLFRDEETLQAQHYYKNLPQFGDADVCFLLDPMLATGGSSSEAIHLLKEHGARKIFLLTLISAPEGIREINEQHPDVAVFTASIDEKLNESGYIVPGLGDAGDRYFGT